ncbi:MAG: hypothetical protein JSS82_09875 [Bacteroidetes bacterium]|nr:hypothetical protein [Bacteroidota bacterium]
MPELTPQEQIDKIYEDTYRSLQNNLNIREKGEEYALAPAGMQPPPSAAFQHGIDEKNSLLAAEAILAIENLGQQLPPEERNKLDERLGNFKDIAGDKLDELRDARKEQTQDIQPQEQTQENPWGSKFLGNLTPMQGEREQPQPDKEQQPVQEQEVMQEQTQENPWGSKFLGSLTPMQGEHDTPVQEQEQGRSLENDFNDVARDDRE